MSNGKATFSTSSLPVGIDSITAVYGGDSNFSSSTSNNVSLTIMNRIVVKESRMQIEQDYYSVLGITANADIKEISQAYRKLAFQYHPDRNQNDPEANRKMQEINEAYATLADPKKRRSYHCHSDITL